MKKAIANETIVYKPDIFSCLIFIQDLILCLKRFISKIFKVIDIIFASSVERKRTANPITKGANEKIL